MMKQYDVWIYHINPDGVEPIDEYVGSFNGYVSEIAEAVLTLHPLAVGILIQPDTTIH